MPALVCVPPAQFLEILKKAGFRVLQEDVWNWVLARNETDIPITLPKTGDFVAVDVTMDLVLSKAGVGMARYLDLVAETGGIPN